jgi:hypothetical protein
MSIKKDFKKIVKASKPVFRKLQKSAVKYGKKLETFGQALSETGDDFTEAVMPKRPIRQTREQEVFDITALKMFGKPYIKLNDRQAERVRFAIGNKFDRPRPKKILEFGFGGF